MKMKNLLRALLFVIFTIVTTQIHYTESLYCYRCLALECPGDSTLCASVRSFIYQELGELYLIGNTLDSCPDPSDLSKWRAMESKNPKCESKGSTCSLGRIRVITKDKNDKKVTSHATILGCSTSAILKSTVRSSALCSSITADGTGGSPYKHRFEIEHCHKGSDNCIMDYCVLPGMSVVESYGSMDRSFEYGTTIAIIATVVIIVVILIIGSLFRPPPFRLNYSAASQI